MLESFRSSTPPHILDITDRVWARKNLFVLWSKICLLFIPDAVRVKYHQYTTEQKGRLGDAGITPDPKIRLLAPEDLALMVQYLIETPRHFSIWNMDLMALGQTINPL